MKDSDLFEKKVKNECTIQGIVAEKFPVQFRKIRGIYIRVKSFVDYSLAIDGRAVYLDCKVTADRLFNLKEYVLHPKKVHQLHHLIRVQSFGARGGFLIWFQKHESICWVPVEAIQHAISLNIASITPASKYVITQSDSSQLFPRELIFRQGPFLSQTKNLYIENEQKS